MVFAGFGCKRAAGSLSTWPVRCLSRALDPALLITFEHVTHTENLVSACLPDVAALAHGKLSRVPKSSVRWLSRENVAAMRKLFTPGLNRKVRTTSDARFEWARGIANESPFSVTDSSKRPFGASG